MGYKPSVLVFIDWYLPGYKAGGPIRSCANMVDQLRHEMNFLIVTGDRDYTDDIPYEGVRPNEWMKRREGEEVIYLDPEHRSAAHLSKIVRLKNVDHVYINGVFSKEFSIRPLKVLKSLGKPITIASRGMFRPSAMAIKKAKKSLFILMARLTGLYNNVTFHATDTEEESHIKSVLGEKTAVHKAPNLPRTLSADGYKPKTKKPNELHLTFAGRVAPEKNLLFLLEILRDYITENNNSKTIKLDIYGAIYSEDYWESCRKVMDILKEHMAISYKGTIPSDDMLKALSEVQVMILPTRGENFGHVILESMMGSTPVIISDQTPWQDLKEQGAGVVCQSNKDYHDALNLFINMNQSDYDTWTRGAFDKAHAYCNDQKVINMNKALFLGHVSD